MGERGGTVALAGGTGFTGRRVAARLARAGVNLRVLVRSHSDLSVLPPGATSVVGDLSDNRSVTEWLHGCETLLYVASMGFGHVPLVLDAARAQGVSRGVFVSTTAIFTRLAAPSKARRVAAESDVTTSGLRWTILRPTMIYGAKGDRNVERLLRAVTRWPVIPVPGSGQSLLQPVHVDDLAAGIVLAASAEQAIGKIYELSGRTPLTLDAAIDAAAHACGRRGRRIHVPLGGVAGVLRTIEKLGISPPVKSEQVLRLAEDKAFPHDAAARDFAFAPRAFEVGVAEEARSLGLAP